MPELEIKTECGTVYQDEDMCVEVISCVIYGVYPVSGDIPWLTDVIILGELVNMGPIEGCTPKM
jgi:hypothetical protein